MPPKSHRGEDLSFVNMVKNVWVAVALIGFIHSGQIGEMAQKASIFYHSVSVPSKIRYDHKTEDLRYTIFAVSRKKTSVKEHFYPDVRWIHVQTKKEAWEKKKGWKKRGDWLTATLANISALIPELIYVHRNWDQTVSCWEWHRTPSMLPLLGEAVRLFKRQGRSIKGRVRHFRIHHDKSVLHWSLLPPVLAAIVRNRGNFLSCC